MILSLAIQATAFSQSEPPATKRGTAGFAHSVLAVPDVDDDAIMELVVADWSARSLGSPPRSELFLYSPGKGSVLGSFDIGDKIEVGSGAHGMTCLSPKNGEEQVAILAYDHEGGITRNCVLVLSISSMEVTSTTLLMDLPESTRWGAIKAIGPGSGEVLISFRPSHRPTEKRWLSEAVVIDLAFGVDKMRTRIKADGIAPVGDLNGDDLVECVVSKGDAHEVYSLGDETSLFSFSEQLGEQPSRCSYTFFPGTDIDGDGKSEFVMASYAILEAGNEYAYRRKLSVRSGSNGQELLRLGDYSSKSRTIDLNVLVCPDQDDDEVPDFVVAICAPYEACSKWLVISGKSGNTIAKHNWTVESLADDIGMTWGQSMANIGDIDNDRIGDFVFSRGSSRIASGRGALLFCSSSAGQMTTITREQAFPEEYAK